ncbi:hypothetical protein [Halogranum rubrum]|uniref:DUF8113 domain-containing protein n=1 Tax=Halogranum salarium B-1 TaxID=1210908 RepID=J3JEP5_9EURY|nr:hypothetical protein [Halogranum salarium]EJN58539.1 hypothetical protein HSB1_30170 [Halogranum salarium B-1]
MDDAFQTELDAARDLLDDDSLTAFHVGVVRDGEEIDTTYSYRTDDSDGDGEHEGLQALSLLATHLRVVADEAGVDYETVATDAVTLATQVEEAPTDETGERE